jgi:hypothetical protein
VGVAAGLAVHPPGSAVSIAARAACAQVYGENPQGQ